MPLVPEMTVGDAIKEIATRLGFTDQGTARTRAESRIQSFIRQAISELAVEVTWTDNLFEVRIPLVNGQDRYEYPEEASNGSVQSFQIEWERGQRYDLQGGIRTQDMGPRPDDGVNRVPLGDPEFVRIIDREVQIRPAPIDITRTTTLVVTLQYAVPQVIELTTQLPFDPELILQRCVVLGRRHYQLPGQDDATRDYDKYLARVKARQGVSTTFFVGGMKSHFVTRDKQVRQNPYRRDIGNNAPYTPNWTPW